jgi:predicted DNA-binding transcriptional regulator AlpA
MRSHTHPLIASGPIDIHERAPSLEANARSSLTTSPDEPRANAPRTGAKSTDANRGDLLAGMRNHTDPPIASEPVCIDEQELSRRTTLSRTTLQTMRRKGGGPPFAKLGHRIVYRLADVERWIAERTR